MKAAIQMIREADRGQLMDDLQDGIGKIVEAIESAHGAGTGEITIKLKISSPTPGAYEIVPDLTVKSPKPKRLKSTMFLSDDGELQRNDPRQPTMPSVIDADRLNRRANLDD